ncbi:hypothetical protein G6F38_005101 [Rhizopus arrhizus]|nr:hypothetical protein G6F38_005101 [Rhizopus arrhizus]
MVSKQTLTIIGLQLTVYGLEEYKKLPEAYPASIMFALHGRLQNQSSVGPLCEKLCWLNDHKDFAKRHLIVVSFDSPNHGSRLVDEAANYGWKEKGKENERHGLDMWSMLYGTSRTVSELMDVIEHYLFGPLERPRVETWGVVGFSMGGHASFLAAAEDPRLSVAIPIVGTSDFLALMTDRLKENGLSAETCLPSLFCHTVALKTANLHERLKSTHLLIINGQEDRLVKAEFNEPLVRQLHKIHQGKEGVDWMYRVLPNVGHAWCPEMTELCMNWTDQWMLKREKGKLVSFKAESDKQAMPNGGNNLKSSSDISLESNGTKDDVSLEKTVTDTERDQKSFEEGCDGGYGWFVVLGSFMVQITSFGVISSCSDPKSLVNLSFVGTLALIFSYGLSPIVQVCTSIYGVRAIMMVGTLLIVISLEMAGFATQVWHLYLTQGVLFGIGASCMYVTVMAVTPQWFTRNRGIALGIVAGGSGMGGLVIPLIYTSINQRLGSGWTYRIMGFICLACDVLACVFVKEREKKRERKRLREIVQLDVLKNFNFLLFSVGSDIALLGYFVPLFFVPSYASYLGLSESQGSSLVSVASAMNFVGRLAAG